MTDAAQNRPHRLVVVSNRLPLVLTRGPDGSWRARQGQGGLVTALAPVLRDRGGLWIGWPGATEDSALATVRSMPADETGYTIEPVALTDEELDRYYRGFSNEILWPLFHDMPGRCNFDPGYWPTYQQVNRKFAETVARCTTEHNYVWVQDYHLMLVADELRRAGVSRTVGFFLHIPFPPVDIFVKMPWRFQVLEALLRFDLVGFQTRRDMRNFVACVRALMPGLPMTTRYRAGEVTLDGHTAHVGAFPIGIDYRKFVEAARSKEVADRAWFIHEALPDHKVILGVDRLDYTKGIPHRIDAFALALERHPEMRRRVVLVQVVVPSREDMPEYAELRTRIERRISRVNGRFTESGWAPIQYIYRSLSMLDLLAYYRTSEIALVTPLKDGMNLVAKEFCACSLEQGVLVLSEFAGAAAQLQKGALLVNPFDVEGTADAIHRAFTMEPQQRRERMRRLRHNVARQNVFWWVDTFLRAAIDRDLSHFPPSEYFSHSPEDR